MPFCWEKLNRGVSKPGCFPLFSGKVQIVSQTLSGLFLVGALNRPRKRKRTNQEDPQTIPEQIGKIPGKSGKSQEGQKRTKRKDKSRSGSAPVWNPPRFPEGPRIEKIQSREALLKKSSFQYGMNFSIENDIFIPGPSLAAEKQGLGLKFSIKNEKISSGNENLVRATWGNGFFPCVRARMDFFDPRALCRKVADVWEKDVWEFQAKSGSSGACCPFLHFLGENHSSKNVWGNTWNSQTSFFQTSTPFWWAIPPVRLALSGRNSGRTPETLSERFLEFPSRVRLGCPKPYNSRHLRLPEHFQNYLPPPQYGWGRFFFQKWFRRGPPRAVVMEFPAVLSRERKKHIKKKTRKQNFQGIVPGFWGGISFMCFFSPIRNDPKKTHKQLFGTHPVPGQSRTFVYMFMCFFFPWFSFINFPILLQDFHTHREDLYSQYRTLTCSFP